MHLAVWSSEAICWPKPLKSGTPVPPKSMPLSPYRQVMAPGHTLLGTKLLGSGLHCHWYSWIWAKGDPVAVEVTISMFCGWRKPTWSNTPNSGARWFCVLWQFWQSPVKLTYSVLVTVTPPRATRGMWVMSKTAWCPVLKLVTLSKGQGEEYRYTPSCTGLGANSDGSGEQAKSSWMLRERRKPKLE